jgi:hypothetical protein
MTLRYRATIKMVKATKNQVRKVRLIIRRVKRMSIQSMEEI